MFPWLAAPHSGGGEISPTSLHGSQGELHIRPPPVAQGQLSGPGARGSITRATSRLDEWDGARPPREGPRGPKHPPNRKRKQSKSFL